MCKLKNPRFAYIAPTFKQAKSIAWDYMKQFTDKIPYIKFNETELRVDLPNGARITLLGAENSDGLEVYILMVVLLMSMLCHSNYSQRYRQHIR